MKIRLAGPVSALACLAALGTAPLKAQLPADGVTWRLYGLEAGTCIHFLISPDAAKSQLRSGDLGVRADQMPGIDSALIREIAAESQYAAWIPSHFCWFAFDSTTVGTRTSRVKKDARRFINYPVAIGVWAIAGAPTDATGQSGWRVVSIFSTSGDLSQSLVPGRYAVDDAKMTISPIDSTPDTRYTIEFEKNIVGWDGHLGDPMPAGRAADTLSVGQTYVRLSLALQMGDSAFEPLGNLRFTGKGDLVTAMTAGPIRMVAPIRTGAGPFIWHFTRQ